MSRFWNGLTGGLKAFRVTSVLFLFYFTVRQIVSAARPEDVPALGNTIMLTGIAYGLAIGSRAAGQWVNNRFGQPETKE